MERIEFCGFRDCIRLKNESIEVIISTEVGPRILSLKTSKGENLYKVLDDHKGVKGGDEFRLYGGHRLWYSPEVENTYIADNVPIEYRKTQKGAEFFTATEKTGLQKSFKVHLEKNCVIIENRIANKGTAVSDELSAWGLCVFDGGLTVVPNSEYKNGFMSNRSITLWDYSKMNDSRVYWGDKYITMKHDPSAKTPFKFGMSVDKLWAANFVKGCLAVKTFGFNREKAYPNGMSNFETYTCKDFTEIESLSPMTRLGAGEEITHTERLYLYDNCPIPKANDESDITKKLDAWLRVSSDELAKV